MDSLKKVDGDRLLPPIDDSLFFHFLVESNRFELYDNALDLFIDNKKVTQFFKKRR